MSFNLCLTDTLQLSVRQGCELPGVDDAVRQYVFSELAPRLIQSISRNVRDLSVFLSVFPCLEALLPGGLETSDQRGVANIGIVSLFPTKSDESTLHMDE